ncbi:hypothetical protein [Xanthomonas sacchari]|uniref:hypothetical protein n=1 Tax=Xanthomonas sacchari TaxID=56458 RepID=UPI002252D3E3|nr:hypothetical protein [Xanthomonas sacchari]MCW0370239.1 hypothetical protein [Xanthomonas sacchari]
MSAVIDLNEYRPRMDSAHAAFSAVYQAATRMGYAHHLAMRAGRQAKQDVLDKRGSAAWVVASIKRALQQGARSEGERR